MGQIMICESYEDDDVGSDGSILTFQNFCGLNNDGDSNDGDNDNDIEFWHFDIISVGQIMMMAF